MTQSSSSAGVTANREVAAVLRDGRIIEAVTLRNKKGIQARILSFGATLQSLIAPDAYGHCAEITLGHDDAIAYVQQRNFFGVTVGRYANRIAKGRFSIDSIPYQLQANDGLHTSHGGTHGFDQCNWTISAVGSGAGAAYVELVLTSPHGDMGYPGAVEARVTYALDAQGDLSITMAAKVDRPTILNMTNHALFNLAGDGSLTSAMNHRLTVPASRFLPVDAGLLPTGEMRLVLDGPFDFTQGRILREALGDSSDPQNSIACGYDHCFVLDKGQTSEPAWAAQLADPVSGRVLDVLTTEPGIQLYTGTGLNGTILGRGGRLYQKGDGVALEPQKFPDTPNRASFGSARVDEETPYLHRMIYRMSVDKQG